MDIIWHEKTKQFHLCNDTISYVMYVQPNGELGHLYFGKCIHDREDFGYLVNRVPLPVTAYYDTKDYFSIELNGQEYPSFGAGDFGSPAFKIIDQTGSGISNFTYLTHEITSAKKQIPGLPATYAAEDEAMTLEVELVDEFTGMHLFLSYSIFRDFPVITRSARFENRGKNELILDRALSLCLDLTDADYEWLQFSGAWARERHIKKRKLCEGITAIESRRGHSGANQNPFVILKRPDTTEEKGEALGFSFVYSGNFFAEAQGDANQKLRFIMGIHPDNFSWIIKSGEKFSTPEVVMARTENGLNDLSHTFHSLYNNHLVRGKWKNKERPILLNNWEATYMDFDEDKILQIASKAKEAGVELFVLDDGWFGTRNDDTRGLGDWFENREKLPDGIKGLAEKITAMGMKFGFWIEPEMVNPDSELYRIHPDWTLSVPGRKSTLCRNQMVLDYSRQEVVDHIHDMIYKILNDAPVSYIKWDMNRSITECFSNSLTDKEQGMVYHKYILGVYQLYERLINEFPDILFESCASGGGRFDAGMFYFAPQAWCSDDTDAEERVFVQYGTSYGYPISFIGAHVSAVPNHQTRRTVPMAMRGNVAMFGAFGYELDLNRISEAEFEMVKDQIVFVKEHRKLLQYGVFYRLSSPFESDQASWMVVSDDKKKALLAVYSMRANVNRLRGPLKLSGLDSEKMYKVGDRNYYGDELMNVGLPLREDIIPGFNMAEDSSSAVVEISEV
ncbi:MAG: alpha-galactosidase [Eubacterium sp.]|nr:alpha-galactosidase [Eubacterium sp.]